MTKNLYRDFAILIVTKDDIIRLKETLNSISPYLSHIKEIVIQDSMSSDGTREFVLSKFPQIKYYREKDSSIYHGMNLGVSKITNSNYVLMLNCGDYLLFDENSSFDIKTIDYNKSFYMNTLLLDEFGLEKLWTASHNKLSKFMSINHQSVFINVAIFKKLNGFSLNYKIASDYDFFRRHLSEGFDLVKIDVSPICKFQSFGGFSDKYRFRLEAETAKIRFKFTKNILIFLVHFLRFIKYKL